MDSIMIIIAFALGFAARQIGLPPLIGYLVAGFAIKASGVEGGALIVELSDVGVLLLLFTIGLKLKLRSPAGAGLAEAAYEKLEGQMKTNA